MARGRRKPATKPAEKPATEADPETIAKALAELGIDRPYMQARMVGSRIELSLYGGDVVFWPPEPEED